MALASHFPTPFTGRAFEIAKLLLDAGADAKSLDEDGVTPADAARGFQTQH